MTAVRMDAGRRDAARQSRGHAPRSANFASRYTRRDIAESCARPLSCNIPPPGAERTLHSVSWIPESGPERRNAVRRAVRTRSFSSNSKPTTSNRTPNTAAVPLAYTKRPNTINNCDLRLRSGAFWLLRRFFGSFLLRTLQLLLRCCLYAARCLSPDIPHFWRLRCRRVRRLPWW